MALIEFKDLPNKSTPMTSKNVNFNFKEILNLIFPIGRGFIDFTNTDYSDYLGFTWKRELINLTPIGCDESGSNVGITKGNENHKHTLNDGYADIIASQGYIMMNYKGLSTERNVAIGYPISSSSTGSLKDKFVTNLGGTTDEESSYQPSKVVAY